MFLQPSEVGFLKYLKEARVPVVEFDFPAKKIVNVQSQLEKLISQNYYLNKVSQRLMLSVCQYATNSLLSSLPKKVTVLTSKLMRRTRYAPFSTYTSWILSRWPRASVSLRRLVSTSSLGRVSAETRSSSSRDDAITAASQRAG